MDKFLRKQEAVMDKYDPEKRVTPTVDEWGAWHAPLANLTGGRQFKRPANQQRSDISNACESSCGSGRYTFSTVL